MFLISNITNCSKITKKCIYLTHNDIKQENIIFKLTDTTTTLKNDYKIEFIDYGGIIFSESFFTNIIQFTPMIVDLVYGNHYNGNLIPTSPLFDIAATIYTMFIIMTQYDEKIDAFYDIVTRLKEKFMTNNLIAIRDLYVELVYLLIDIIHASLFQPIDKSVISNNHYTYDYALTLITYLNFALCIYRYHKINIPPSGYGYNGLQFKDFEFLNIHLSLNKVTSIGFYIQTIGFSKFQSTEKNNNLLKSLVNYINASINNSNLMVEY